MPSLARGLYEILLTQLVDEELHREDLHEAAELNELRNAEAADRIALHLAKVVEAAIENLPEDERAFAGTQLARRLVELIAGGADEGLAGMQLTEPGKILRAIRKRLPDGSYESVDKPLIPLLDTTLLTNAPGEPRVGHQIHTEIASADRIDVVMAFIRRSGLLPHRDVLRAHVNAGRSIRVLTTTYTGSTEAEALELLAEL